MLAALGEATAPFLVPFPAHLQLHSLPWRQGAAGVATAPVEMVSASCPRQMTAQCTPCKGRARQSMDAEEAEGAGRVGPPLTLVAAGGAHHVHPGLTRHLRRVSVPAGLQTSRESVARFMLRVQAAPQRLLIPTAARVHMSQQMEGEDLLSLHSTCLSPATASLQRRAALLPPHLQRARRRLRPPPCLERRAPPQLLLARPLIAVRLAQPLAVPAATAALAQLSSFLCATACSTWTPAALFRQRRHLQTRSRAPAPPP